MSLTSYRAAPPRGGMISWTGRPGGGLLSRALRHSTMGAGGFHGRVREGIGCGPPAKATMSSSPSHCAVFRPPGVEPASGSRLSFTGRVIVRPADEVLVCVVVPAMIVSPAYLAMISMHGVQDRSLSGD